MAIAAEMARQEQSTLLRVGPKRNRWRDLQRFDERLAAVDRRQAEVRAQLEEVKREREAEPAAYKAAIADWLQAGEKGEKPTSRLEELDRRIAELQAEAEAQGLVRERLLVERGEHVRTNRKRMAADVNKAVHAVEAEAQALVDQLEQKRQELLELRATEVWVRLFPDEKLASEPATQALAGARKSVQSRHLPGVEAGLSAPGVFALLREDARFCATVSTVDQAAALEGVSSARLTGREAVWEGPDEERARQKRERDARLEAYRREWGHLPPEWPAG